VRVRDVQPASLTRALATARQIADERARRRRGGSREVDGQMARILPTLELEGFGRSDLAIEAVVEDLDIKRRVLAELEVRIRPDAVLATNTSSLSVGELGAGLQHPERFCGIHFFNPVHRMPLVEVVRGPKTSDATLVTAVGYARKLGKTPVVVNDAPGFVVNRILMPYLREALHLLEEGYPVATIDGAMKAWGMPMGPFEVTDEVGLDVAAKVAGILARAFPERMSTSESLAAMIAAGRLGRKTGRGFYVHRGRKRSPDPEVRGLLKLQRERKLPSAEPITSRMALAMANEACPLPRGARGGRRGYHRRRDGVRRRLPAVPRRAAALGGCPGAVEGRGPAARAARREGRALHACAAAGAARLRGRELHPAAGRGRADRDPDGAGDEGHRGALAAERKKAEGPTSRVEPFWWAAVLALTTTRPPVLEDSATGWRVARHALASA
jgi:3-hydroxyacyl-CoA dehydrogenase